MYTIETLNSISHKGLEKLPAPLFTIKDEDESLSPDGILLRSYNMLDMELPENLLAVARAGAGTNNIPINACTEKGIVVFNTPGANANAVKELVLAGLVLSSRNVVGGIEWVNTLKDEGDAVAKLVEKGKNRFAGPELEGRTLGIVGLGAIGVRVANMATHLHMQVLGYDPFISVDAAWSLSRSVIHSVTLTEVIQKADYITLHLPVNKDTTGLVNKEFLAQMKPGARLLNFARGELVDTKAVLSALKHGQLAAYITDFPSAELIGQPGVICIPHLGASTPDSEDNCAVMAARQIKDYLLNGNIQNSVNFPAVSAPRNGGSRICGIHRNSKGILAAMTAVAHDASLNIDNMTNKSRGDYAYTLIDVAGEVEDAVVEQLKAIDGMVRLRVL